MFLQTTYTYPLFCLASFFPISFHLKARVQPYQNYFARDGKQTYPKTIQTTAKDVNTAPIVAPEASLQDSFVKSFLVSSSPVARPERLLIEDEMDVLDINYLHEIRDAEVEDLEPEASI